MNFKEWKSLWRFDCDVRIPHASIVVMTPYCFARVLWYSTSKEFKAWPNKYETGLVLGLRWPFTPEFREWQWVSYSAPMSLAIYGGPMDEVYLARATMDLLLFDPTKRFNVTDPDIRHIGPTVKALLQQAPPCDHTNYWTADCAICARKALRLAIQLKALHEPAKMLDPHEDPIKRFRRQEAERRQLLEGGNNG